MKEKFLLVESFHDRGIIFPCGKRPLIKEKFLPAENFFSSRKISCRKIIGLRLLKMKSDNKTNPNINQQQKQAKRSMK